MSVLSVKKPNIIVFGDIMYDYNIYVKPQKFANEAPIPVYNFISEEYKLGGCGNVLKNLYNLGCDNLYIFSIVGNDINGTKIKEYITSLKIHNYIETLDEYRTIVKKRFFCDNKILFRCDTENDTTFDTSVIEDIFIGNLKKIIRDQKINCIIISDYNKGTMSFNLCQSIIKISNINNIFTCVDPKNNYEKYVGCSLIKPNIHEAYNLFNINSDTSILDLHKIIFDKIKCKYSVITLSEKGITLFDGKNIHHGISKSHNIIDVTGAGDIVCSVLGYFMSQNVSPQKSIYISTNIATKSVQYPGTYLITRNDIIDVEFKGKKIIEFADLSNVKELYKNCKTVFTNGCFDILHNGHINLFKFCKERGDILIIALNSDTSIKKLKGDTRPINNIETRLAILESISYIDYIIIFEEDSPLNIIKELQPYYLVKGGDYCIETIIGREYANETLVCELVKNISSSKIIEKIKSIYK